MNTVDPRVQTLIEPPMYRQGSQPQSALGVFVVGDATAEFGRTVHLIDFTGGLVVGLAAGDLSWTSLPFETDAQVIALSTSVAVLFAIGETPDLVNGPMLLSPGIHYFRILPSEDTPSKLHWRLLDGQPEGYLTLNAVIS